MGAALSARHSQTAFAHRPAHRRPQRPQFIGSRFASTHRSPQSRNQSSHRAAHRPDVHTVPSSQTRPQAPQFAGSFAGRVSHPFSGLSSQSAAPRWQTTPQHPWAHAPLPFGGFAQSVLTRHMRTTGAGSLTASTATSAATSAGAVTASHRPERHVSSARQDAPQAPQWTGLRDVSTHAPRHTRSPGGQPAVPPSAASGGASRGLAASSRASGAAAPSAGPTVAPSASGGGSNSGAQPEATRAATMTGRSVMAGMVRHPGRKSRRGAP